MIVVNMCDRGGEKGLLGKAKSHVPMEVQGQPPPANAHIFKIKNK